MTGHFINVSLRSRLVRRLRMHLRVPLIIASFFLLSACSTLQYYGQSIQGQAEIISKSKPVHVLITETPDSDLSQQLRLVQQLLEFAEDEFLLPNSGSYTHYADVQRPYVLWNVFATPRLSLQPKEWCYPVIGCLSYRGYFHKQDARDLADDLKQEGYDVFVGGVTAYSTLGWFQDPVLNTMLNRGESYLARVIFHELAHQKLYVSNDTGFNEAFADSVAEIALQQWLIEHHPADVAHKQLQRQQREKEFVSLLLRYRNQLQELYKSGLADTAKLDHKQKLFDALQYDYQTLRMNWNGASEYDSWFNAEVNNARIICRQHLPFPG